MPLIQDPKALKEAVKLLYEAHVNAAKEDTVPDEAPSGVSERLEALLSQRVLTLLGMLCARGNGGHLTAQGLPWCRQQQQLEKALRAMSAKLEAESRANRSDKLRLLQVIPHASAC